MSQDTIIKEEIEDSKDFYDKYELTSTYQNVKKKRKRKKPTLTKNYKCPKCDLRYRSNAELKEHGWVHTGEKPYNCSYCIKSFVRMRNLKHHEITHSDTNPYICQTCGYTTSTPAYLKQHISRVHAVVKKHKCNNCGKLFPEGGSLTRHMRTHTGEKPYSCRFCDYKTSQSSRIATHEISHTGFKPYKCPLCDNMYKCRKAFKKHVRRHAEEPFLEVKECIKDE